MTAFCAALKNTIQPKQSEPRCKELPEVTPFFVSEGLQPFLMREMIQYVIKVNCFPKVEKLNLKR